MSKYKILAKKAVKETILKYCPNQNCKLDAVELKTAALEKANTISNEKADPLFDDEIEAVKEEISILITNYLN